MKALKSKSNVANAKPDKTQLTVFPPMKRPIISLGEMDDDVMDGLLDSTGKFFKISSASLYYYPCSLISRNMTANTRLNNRYQIIKIYKHLCKVFEHGNIYFSLIKKGSQYLKRKCFIKELPLIGHELYVDMIEMYKQLDSRFPNVFGQNFNQMIYSYKNPSYIDVMCNYLCSRLVESNILPHFPLFYGSVTTLFNKYTYTFGDSTEYRDFRSQFSRKKTANYNIINKEDKNKVQVRDLPVILMASEVMDYDFKDFLEESFEKYEEHADKFDKSLYESHILSILFQTIVSLTVVQSLWNMCHNDLHLGNIMFKKTKHEYINYHFKGIFYRVRTYGTMVKIIDWNRATLTLNGVDMNNICYDTSFECEGMYYFPSTLPKSKTAIKPNCGFDLALLAYELLDQNMIFDKTSKIHKLLMDWTTTSNGSNIYTDLGGKEQEADFELYQRIAQECFKSVPVAQFQKAIWNCFKVDKSVIPIMEHIYSINV